MYILKRISKIILISLLCYSCFVILPTEQVSADRETASKLENYIESYLEEYQVPGASVAIVHKGEIFYAQS